MTFKLFYTDYVEQQLRLAALFPSVTSEIMQFSDNEIQAINAYAAVTDPSHIINTNVVKVTVDVNSNAIAFSRHPIPYPMSGDTEYFQQLGLYAFKKSALTIYADQAPRYIEKSEGIEMYRLIENGYKIKMIILLTKFK